MVVRDHTLPPEQTQLKTCRKCGETKPTTRQYFREARRVCRNCERANRKMRYAINGEQERAYQKAYYTENIEQLRANARQYAKLHAEERRAYGRERYIANPSIFRTRAKEYYKDNAEERRAYGKAYYKANPEKVRITRKKYRKLNQDKIKAWRTANPDKTQEYAHRRRARKRNTGGTYTIAELRAIRAAQTDKKGRLHCWWCGCVITDTPHIDHKIALSKGGTNEAGNICYACASCNVKKNAKSPAEFAGRLL